MEGEANPILPVEEQDSIADFIELIDSIDLAKLSNQGNECCSLPSDLQQLSLAGPSCSNSTSEGVKGNEGCSLPSDLQQLSLAGPSCSNSTSEGVKGNEGCSLPSDLQQLSLAGPSCSNSTSEGVVWFSAGKEADLQQKEKRTYPPARKQPIRVSQRIKKKPDVLTYDCSTDNGYIWPERKLAGLYAGCVVLGTENMEGLQRYVPEKKEKHIKRQLNLWKAIGEQATKDQVLGESDVEPAFDIEKVKNLDEWIEYFHKNKSNAFDKNIFSDYFLLFAEYGDLPSKEECGGVDPRDMYRYLHCMLNGIPFYGLDDLTKRVILKCIKNVKKTLNNPELIERLSKQLNDLPTEPDVKKFGKTYSREPKTDEQKLQKLLSHPDFNPLNLPTKEPVPEIIPDNGEGEEEEEEEEEEVIEIDLTKD
ncbi:uncharacterized protein LOC128998783 [Macrosteles quadrilineatus]|uniref:uncharacterized protein LOC128998783 n=1 Tax=Macrosteles quadrilineatus TaxID=74068 RepID=UPI0023E11AD4|nr:uncharacterized protein LOC128998783 [Macrosteles quadrilineatus]